MFVAEFNGRLSGRLIVRFRNLTICILLAPFILLKDSWSSGNAFVSGAVGLRFKSEMETGRVEIVQPAGQGS